MEVHAPGGHSPRLPAAGLQAQDLGPTGQTSRSRTCSWELGVPRSRDRRWPPLVGCGRRWALECAAQIPLEIERLSPPGASRTFLEPENHVSANVTSGFV